MQKKVLVVAAMLALFVCGGVFAQEAEVPETEAPVAETPEAEASAAESSGGGSSILDSMYAGLDIGTDFGSFYMAPRVGITPFKKVPKLAFEFLFGMQLGGKYQTETFPRDLDPGWQINIFSPTILVTYTFSDWMIRPYAGLGFGVNIFAVKDRTWTDDDPNVGGNTVDVDDSLKLDPSFNTLLTAGAKYAIPNTNFELNVGLNLSLIVFKGDLTRKKAGVGPVNFGSKPWETEGNDAINYFLFDYDIIIGAVYHL